LQGGSNFHKIEELLIKLEEIKKSLWNNHWGGRPKAHTCPRHGRELERANGGIQRLMMKHGRARDVKPSISTLAFCELSSFFLSLLFSSACSTATRALHCSSVGGGRKFSQNCQEVSRSRVT
jgi:hypothetical protein